MSTEQFKAGQVWKYNNRAGEDSSTLIILKAEQYEQGGTIIHIAVQGLRIYNPATADHLNHIGHLPFGQQALESSVTTLIEQQATLPDFQEGYDQWKEAWDNGQAGYWTIDVQEAIQGIESALRP